MKLLRNHIRIGIEKPFTVLHASDTHISFADDRDDERKLRLSEDRTRRFGDAWGNLQYIKEKALSENRTVIYTGDLLDFVSELNIEKAKEFTDSVDVFMAAGNHEFSLYLGEAKEDADYRNKSLPKVQSAFRNNIRFSSREINGVLFIALDNSYYLIDEEQFTFLKNECKKGLPVILCMHTPLYTREIFDYSREYTPVPAYLMSVPEELMRDYPADRFEQQKQDALTAEVYDYIVSCEAIKALLTGHIHKDYAGLINGKIQIASDIATLREIYID